MTARCSHRNVFMNKKLLSGLVISFAFYGLSACGAPRFTTQAPPPPPPPPEENAPTSELEPAPVLEATDSQDEGFVLDEDRLDSLSFHQGWARVPFNFGVFGGYGLDQMNDVVAGGPGIVAGGYGVRNGDLDAMIWHSQNAVDWQREEEQASLGGPGTQVIAALASGPAGLVAVGWEKAGDDLDAAAWTSSDGLVWTRVNAAALGGEGNQGMNAVLAVGNGFIAVGWEEVGEEARAAVWTSPNGRSWSRVPHDEQIFGGMEYLANLQDILEVGGALLAVGTIEVPGDQQDLDTGIWASNDGGLSWARITNSDQELGDRDTVRYQLVSGVVYWDNLFIMGASEQNVPGSLSGEYNNGVIYSSADGISWQRIYDHKPDQRQQTLLDVAASEFGFWAVGYEVLGEQSHAAVWFSPDGRTWSQVQHSENTFGGSGLQRINAIATAGPGLVAVGITYENGEQDAAVWIYAPGR